MFHGALGYAVELGLLPANPVGQVRCHHPKPPRRSTRQTVASPAQVRAILVEVARLRPELTAFFGCLYYAALRPEEAVALRRADLVLAPHGRGKLILTAACPRTGSAWTSTGTPHEPRGLKHRPDGAVRVVPIPPVLVRMLRQHLRHWDRAGRAAVPRRPRRLLSESVYGRVWHAARQVALGPDLAATSLARRPYDLRHAALSLWLNASGAPAEVAARAGNSARVLQDVYPHCTDGQEDPSASGSKTPSTRTPDPHVSQCVTASGYTHRWHRPDPVRYMSVNGPRPRREPTACPAAARTSALKTPPS